MALQTKLLKKESARSQKKPKKVRKTKKRQIPQHRPPPPKPDFSNNLRTWLYDQHRLGMQNEETNEENNLLYTGQVGYYGQYSGYAADYQAEEAKPDMDLMSNHSSPPSSYMANCYPSQMQSPPADYQFDLDFGNDDGMRSISSGNDPLWSVSQSGHDKR